MPIAKKPSTGKGKIISCLKICKPDTARKVSTAKDTEKRGHYRARTTPKKQKNFAERRGFFIFGC